MVYKINENLNERKFNGKEYNYHMSYYNWNDADNEAKYLKSHEDCNACIIEGKYFEREVFRVYKMIK